MNEKYRYLPNFDECIYIYYIETNIFFRRRGIYNDSVNALFRLIDLNKDIILTNETKIGNLCNTYNHFCRIFKERGYIKKIKTETELSEEIHKSLKIKLVNKLT